MTFLRYNSITRFKTSNAPRWSSCESRCQSESPSLQVSDSPSIDTPEPLPLDFELNPSLKLEMNYSETDIAIASLLFPDTSQYSYSTTLKYDEPWPAILPSGPNDMADINSHRGWQSAIPSMHDQWPTPLPWGIVDETYSVLPNASPIPPSHALPAYNRALAGIDMGLSSRISITHSAFQRIFNEVDAGAALVFGSNCRIWFSIAPLSEIYLHCFLADGTLLLYLVHLLWYI